MQIVNDTRLAYGTVRNMLTTSSCFPVTDNGHGLFSLDPSYNPDGYEINDPPENGIPYWSGEESWAQGSLPRALGGNGMVMPHPSSDEQFDLQRMVLEEKFERVHDRWRELHGRRDLGELDE